MTKTLKVPALMHLLCDLLLSAACWGFTFTAAHVPGGENKIADLSFPLAGIQAAGPGGPLVPLSDSSAPAGQLNTSSLEQHCLHFLAQGLAPSTQKAYATGQRKFLEFCRQAGKLHSSGSPCPSGLYVCLFHFLQIRFNIL